MTIASALFRALRVLAVISIGLVLPAISHAAEVTDILGRKVNVPDHVSRIVLGEGRLSYALALLDRDNPFQRIVGWQNDLRKLDPHSFETYKKKFPDVANIAVIGETSEVSVSVETILALKPDLVIFSVAGEGPKAHSPIADTLAQAGIAVLYVDFRVSPIENTPKSIAAIGEAIGRQAEAKQFTDFYAQHLDRITSRVAALKDEQKPSVFVELLAGVWQAPGHTTGNGGLGQFVSAVGGRNIAASVVPGAIGDVAVEYVLHADPDIYIATGNRSPGLLLGAGVEKEAAQKSLESVLARPEFKELGAIRDHKAYGLWHDFYNSPYNIVAIEALAKWIHPELFQDIDPAKTQQDMAKSLLAIDNTGTYWVDPSVTN